MSPKSILRAILVLVLAIPLVAQDWFAPQRKDVLPPPPPGDVWRLWTAADFDGDGAAEMLAHRGFGAVALLVRGTDGRFVDRAAERLPVAIAAGVVADLDGDGAPDLVGPPLLRNDGHGTFVDVTASHWPGLQPYTVAHLAFDADADGDLDVLATENGSDTVLWLNDGAGRLARAAQAVCPPVGFSQDAAGDVDGDRRVDLVVRGRLWLNRGGLRFEDVTATHLAGVPPYCDTVALADFDGDGDLDILAGSGWTLGGLHQYHVNDGSGRFADATAARWPDRPYGPIGGFGVADFDGDGRLDVACAIYIPGSDLAGERDPGRDLLYRNDGSGALVEVSAGRLAPDGAQTHAMLAVDIDGDGDADLLAGHVPYVVDSGMAVHVNDGAGRFLEVALPWAIHMSGLEGGFAFGDVDGDGAPDVVAATDEEWTLRRGRGDGSFDRGILTEGRFAAPASSFVAPVLADLDGDGDRDLITLGIGAAWHANAPQANGVPGFAGGTRSLPAPAWTHPWTALPVDLDADGDQDLLLPEYDSTVVLANDGSGGFVDVTPAAGPLLSRHTLAVTDVNGDGVPDLLVANDDGFGPRMHVLIHDGRFRFADETAARWPATALATGRPVVADVDGDGDDDVFVAESVGPDRWLARLLEHDGVGAFVDATAARLPPERPLVTETVDVDLDGFPEALAVDPATRRSWTLWNDGRGGFTLGASVVGGAPLVDLDGDGDMDLRVPARLRQDLAFGRARHLECPTVPRVGERFELRVSVLRRSATAPTIALPVVAVPTAPVELPGVGRLWIDPVAVRTLPWALLAPDGRAATVALMIPNDAAVVGVELVAQALLLDLGATAFALTAPVFETVRN